MLIKCKFIKVFIYLILFSFNIYFEITFRGINAIKALKSKIFTFICSFRNLKQFGWFKS